MKNGVLAIVLSTFVVLSTAWADPPGKARFPAPVRAWFDPQFLDSKPELYVAMNLITSHTDAEVAER